MKNPPKTIVIFLGLKCLGKSLLSDRLKEALQPEHTVRVFHENETMCPIKFENDDQEILEFYSELADKIEATPEEVIVLDRFHPHQATMFPEFFHSIERRLLKNNVYVFLLTIPEDQIEKRLRETKAYRGDGWQLSMTGASFEEEARSDAVRQKAFKEILIPGTLFKSVFMIDTLERKWDEYLAFVLSKLSL